MAELYRRKQQEIDEKENRQRDKESAVKNIFINSNMEYWQRGTSTLGLGTTFSYRVDRWRIEAGGSSASGNITRVTDSPDSTKFPFSAFVYDNGGLVGPTNSSSVSFGQPIEASFIEQYSGKPMTLSFWIRTNNWTEPNINLYLDIRTPQNGIDNYANSVGRIITGDNPLHFREDIAAQVGPIWTKITKKITCPDFSVVNKGMVIGLVQVKSDIVSPSTPQGFYTTGWMLTEGHAEDGYEFEWQRAGKDVTDELRLCQRYLFRYTASQVNDYIAWYRDFGSPGGSATFISPVPMRTFPVIDKNAGLTAYAQSGSAIGINSLSVRNLTGTYISCNCNLQAEISGSVGVVETTTGGYVDFDAEI